MGIIESEELRLFIDNDYELYKTLFIPITTSLAKKKRDGVYDSEKAIKSIHRLVMAGARKYIKEFPDTSIPAAEKRDAERVYRDIFEIEYALGNYI